MLCPALRSTEQPGYVTRPGCSPLHGRFLAEPVNAISNQSERLRRANAQANWIGAMKINTRDLELDRARMVLRSLKSQKRAEICVYQS